MDTPSLQLAPASPQVKRYQHLKLLSLVAKTLLSVAVLFLFAFVLGPKLGPWVADTVGDSRWLQLLVHASILAGCLELSALPISFWSGYILEHRYGLSTQSLGRWLRKKLLSWSVGAIFGAILMGGLYALIWTTDARWWLWTTFAWLFFSLVMGRLVPILILPLFYTISRLDDPSLVSRLRKLTDGTTLTIEGVYRLHLSEETKKANAALTGLGKSRRVLLGDTLLESFTPEEIDVVFAHEVGHHVYRHLLIMIALQVLTSLAGFWLVDRTLQLLAPWLGFGGRSDPAAIPLLLWVLTVFSLLLTPALNALSRVFEVQCDTYALRRTNNREAYRSAFTKLATMNKSDPDPSPWAVILFYDHPPIRARLALADFPPT